MTAADEPFFRAIARWDHPQLQLPVPLFFRTLSALGAVFTARADRAEALLPPGVPLRLVQLTPGRCLLAVMACEYLDGDLGPYGELAIALPVGRRDKPWPPAMSALAQGLMRSSTAWIWQMPVTSPRSMEAGQALAGFPKFLADLRFDAEGSRGACEFLQDGRRVLRLSVDAADAPGERRLKLRAITLQQGLPLQSLLLVRQQRWRDLLQPSRATLELGEGAIADTLRTLELSAHPIAAHRCTRGQAILFPPRNLDDD